MKFHSPSPPVPISLLKFSALLAALTPLSARAEGTPLWHIDLQNGFVGTLVALLIAVLLAPPGLKRLWFSIVVLIAVGSAGVTMSNDLFRSASFMGSGLSTLLPFFYGFWALSFCVLVATRIRYWLRLDRMAQK